MKSTIFALVAFWAVMAYAATAQSADESLVLYLKLDEGAGEEVKDSSSYGNTGLIRGAKWVEGKYGSGLEFDGTVDVEVPDAEILRLTEQATIAAWINAKPDQQGWGRIVDKALWPNSGYDLALNTNTKVYRWEFFVDGVTYSCDGKTPLNNEQWHHVLVTFDNAKKEFRGYADGVAEIVVGGAPDGKPINPSDVPLHLGLYSGGNHHFIGIMDEVIVYNRAVREDEVKGIMDGEITNAAVSPAGNLSTTWGIMKSARFP